MSNSFFSQIKISYYASSQNDLHYRNGWNYGRMGLFTVVGGVGCMLESGIQFNSSIKMITHGSTRDVLFLTTGVVLIKVGLVILITNQRNRKNMSVVNPAIKNETHTLVNSSATIQKDFLLSVCGFL